MNEILLTLTKDEVYTLFCLLSGGTDELRREIIRRDFFNDEDLEKALFDLKNIFSKVTTLV